VVCCAKQVMEFHVPQNAGKFLASLKTISFKENSVRQTYLFITHLKMYCEQTNIYNNLHVPSKKKFESRVANLSPRSNLYSGLKMSKYSRYF